MKKFKELSDLVKKGLIHPDYCKKNPFPATKDDGTEATTHFNGLAEKIAALDLAKVKGVFSRGKGLAEILEEIEEAEQAVEEFFFMGYQNKWLESKSLQVAQAVHSLEDYLDQNPKRLSQQLEEKTKELMKDKDDLRTVSSLRAELDNLADEYWLVKRTAEKRGQKNIPKKINKKFAAYTKQKKGQEKLNQEINKIEKRYQEFALATNPKKELKRLKKKTRTRDWFKSKLVRKSEKLLYFEGLLRLKELNAEIKYVRQNLEEAISFKEEIKVDLSKLKKYSSLEASQVKTVTLSGLKGLKKRTEKLPLNKYAPQKNLIYLKKDILAYQELAQKTLTRTKHIIAAEAARMEDQYSSLKAASLALPHTINEIESYTSQITSTQQDLKELKLKFAELRNKERLKDTSSLLATIKTTLKKTEQAKQAYQKIEALRTATTALKKETKKYGLSPDRIDKLEQLYTQAREIKTELSPPLNKEIGSLSSSLKQETSLLLDSFINSVDEKYQQIGKDHSLHPTYIRSLYGKLHTLRDITDRLKKTEQLIEKAQKKDSPKEKKYETIVIKPEEFKVEDYLKKFQPKNPVFLEMQKVLRNGEEWSSKLAQVEELMQTPPSFYSTYDKTYLNEVVFALEHSLEKGLLGYLVNKKKLSGEKVSQTIHQLEDYNRNYTALAV